jgi:hypothetical protein
MNANGTHVESTAPRPWQFSLRTALIGMTVMALLLATNFLGIVGFHYPRAVENDPLLAPIRVQAIDQERFVLEDGRVLHVVSPSHIELSEKLAGSGNRIDVEEYQPGQVQVFVSERIFVCGMPWARVIEIPLIPDDIPINRRVAVAFAKLEASERVAANRE